MTYVLKMARAAAPAIDRAARRLHDAGYHRVMDTASFQYRNTQLMVKFATEYDFNVGASVLAEELRADGWGWTAVYDNGSARTGNQIGLCATHPRFITQTGDEVRDRPNTWSVTGPMPGGNVYLNAETIERMAQEAAEVIRDALRQQALKEYGRLPEGTFDLPPGLPNPLETQFHRDVAEHNDEPVDAPKPRPLNEVFGTDDEQE